MIVRRSRKLDRSALRRRGVGGQHLGEDLAFFGNHQLLVGAAEVLALLHQRGDIRFLQEVFVEPGELRKYLEIGVIARPKVALRPFRALAGCAIALPQLAIARIAPNHVDRVGLKQILQRKVPVGWR